MASKARKVTKAVVALVVVAAATFGIGRYAFGVDTPADTDTVAVLAQTDEVEAAEASQITEPVRQNDIGRTDNVDGVAVAVVDIHLDGRIVVATVSAMNQNLDPVITGSWGWVTPNGIIHGADALELPAGGAVNGTVTVDAIVGENQLVYSTLSGEQVFVSFTITSEMIEVQR